MLKIVKKTELKPKQVQTYIRSQKEREEVIQTLLNSQKPLGLKQIQSHFELASSINSEHLARLISNISKTLSESNYLQSIDLIISLYQKPHDEKELKFFLKNKYKVSDPILFLLILLERKQKSVSITLASLIIDCYTLTLMLSGKEVITFWKQQIYNLVACLKAREQISGLLIKQKNETKKNGFRSISIPL